MNVYKYIAPGEPPQQVTVVAMRDLSLGQRVKVKVVDGEEKTIIVQEVKGTTLRGHPAEGYSARKEWRGSVDGKSLGLLEFRQPGLRQTLRVGQRVLLRRSGTVQPYREIIITALDPIKGRLIGTAA